MKPLEEGFCHGEGASALSGWADLAFDSSLSSARVLVKFARGARTKADGAAEPLAESIAVGSRVYIEAPEKQLAIRAKGRDVISVEGGCQLRETETAYRGLFER